MKERRLGYSEGMETLTEWTTSQHYHLTPRKYKKYFKALSKTMTLFS